MGVSDESEQVVMKGNVCSSKDNMAREIDTTNGRVHTLIALMLEAIANENAVDGLKF